MRVARPQKGRGTMQRRDHKEEDTKEGGRRMFDKPVTMIAAMAENRVIGQHDVVPWDLPADRGRFRRLTMGNPVIVGWRTYNGFKKDLDGREIIVLGRRKGEVEIGGGKVERAVLEAIEEAEGCRGGTVWVAGGADTYRRMMSMTGEIDLTVIHTKVEGDTWMPEIDAHTWVEAMREVGPTGGPEGLKSTVIRFKRRITQVVWQPNQRKERTQAENILATRNRGGEREGRGSELR